MHAKPDLRVFLKWMIARSGSVITDVIRARGIEMSFSMKTILFAVMVVAAFLCGWMLPSPAANHGQTPVLVAIRDIPDGTTPRASDFRTIYRDIDDVPDYAARTASDLEGVVTDNRVRCNSYFFLDELYPTNTFVTTYVPPGKKVVAIKLVNDLDKLTWYLLSSDDIVSIYTSDTHNQSNTPTCLVPRCTVFSKLNRREPSAISVWLTEHESELVHDAQKQGQLIWLEPPE